ncbi:uncharacterized protein MONBRDRAFT_8989 [Monosiga brevicollis MX1]|uniref:mannonate dehydratase n=1 Tax=Monosiga brevicollis TaxID=81824 RepID=A9V1R4_MONBE|nr:uncharacterized protein MONBRDRAFT_8989 [Monosiga brevicollis MX1]EDQ88606.1 predicted protein [Monosiga brevicollis MX1]|eukprot:XP_001746710.1 hypothetical protein [Monosiga brevicollis MX1]
MSHNGSTTEEAASATQGGTMQAYFYQDLSDPASSPAVAARVRVPDTDNEQQSGMTLSNPNHIRPDGPRVCAFVGPAPTDQELQFVEQMGATHVFTWIEKLADMTPARLAALKDAVERRNLQLNNVGCLELAKCPDIILHTDNYAARLTQFGSMLAMLSEAGIHTTTFTWEASGKVYSTGQSVVRGGGLGRRCNARRLAALPVDPNAPTDEQLWSNLETFVRDVMPLCVQYNMVLALHPNDPPLRHVGGMPCLIRSFSDFERVFALDHSGRLQAEFCCGTISEGLRLPPAHDLAHVTADPALLGSFGDSCEALYSNLVAFVLRQRVAIVHLRNCTACLPDFAETYLDDGFLDIAHIIDLLVQNGYRGTIILDHTPPFNSVDGAAAATAFSLGYDLR